MAVLDRLDAARDELAAMSIDALTHKDVLEVLGRMETHTWALPGITHPLLARLDAEASPVELGATSIAAVISERLRISRDDAHRRFKDARHLGPRRALSGEPLAPKLTHTAAAQAKGLIGPEHVRIIRTFFDDLPDAVDVTTRDHAEATLARIAVRAAARRAAHGRRPPTGPAAPRRRLHRRRPGPAPRDHRRPARPRRDEQDHRPARPRRPRHLGRDDGARGRPRQVQPR